MITHKKEKVYIFLKISIILLMLAATQK